MTKTIPELGNAGSSSVTATDAATGDTVAGRTADGDITFRRVTVGSTAGGLVNTGFVKVGVLASTTSQTDDENTVNQTVNGYDATSGALLHNLAACSASLGRVKFIYKSDSGTNTVTITRAGSDTIDNALTTLVLRRQYEGYLLVCDTTAHWKIIGYFTGDVGSLQTSITDPGNAGAIPVTKSGYCKITSTGADTRTITLPTFVGQQILLIHAVDGGSVAITASAAINIATNTIMTATAVRAWIFLTASLTGSSLVWTVTATDGFTLS